MRLDLRGGTMDPGRTAALLARARTAAFGEVVLRTNALGFQQPEASVALAAQGVHGALVPVFSQHAPVHDRIAGRSGALVQTLVGMRSLASAGLAIEVEVLLHHLPGGAHGAHLPLIKPQGVITQRADRVEIVGDKDDRAPKLQKLLDLPHTLSLEVLVAHRQHLIHQEDLAVHVGGDGEAQAQGHA